MWKNENIAKEKPSAQERDNQQSDSKEPACEMVRNLLNCTSNEGLYPHYIRSSTHQKEMAQKLAIDLNRHFPEENIQMETYPAWLFISETQMKTSAKFRITPVRKINHKRLRKTST